MKNLMMILTLLSIQFCYEAERSNALDPGTSALRLMQYMVVGISGSQSGSGTGTGTSTSGMETVSKNFTFVTSYSVSSVGTISSGYSDISADNTYLFISEGSYNDKIYKLLPDQNSILNTVTPSYCFSPSALAVRNSNKLYCAGDIYYNKSNIYVHDYAGTSLSNFTVFDNSLGSAINSSGSNPMTGMDFWTDTSLVIITSNSNIYYATASGTGTGNVTSKITNTVGNAGITKFNDKLIVGNSTAKKLYLLNSSTGAVLDSITTAQTPVGVVYFQNYLWVLCTDARIYKYTVTN